MHERLASGAVLVSLLVHGVALAVALAMAQVPKRPSPPPLVRVSLVEPPKPVPRVEPPPPPRPVAEVKRPVPPPPMPPRRQAPAPVPRAPVETVVPPPSPPPLVAAIPAAEPSASAATSSNTAPPVRPEPVAETRPVAPAPVAAAPVPAPVTAPLYGAAYLKNPKPAYPSIARRLGLSGVVTLLVQVDAAGQPEQVALHRSSGHDVLDETAMSAVRGWRFVPAKRGETPIAGSVLVPIRFELEP